MRLLFFVCCYLSLNMEMAKAQSECPSEDKVAQVLNNAVRGQLHSQLHTTLTLGKHQYVFPKSTVLKIENKDANGGIICSYYFVGANRPLFKVYIKKKDVIPEKSKEKESKTEKDKTNIKSKEDKNKLDTKEDKTK